MRRSGRATRSTAGPQVWAQKSEEERVNEDRGDPTVCVAIEAEEECTSDFITMSHGGFNVNAHSINSLRLSRTSRYLEL